MIHDAIFAVGSFVLAAALVPTLLAREKPAPATCVLTCAVICSFAACFATLGLWLAFAANALNAALWAVIGLQALRRRRDDARAGAPAARKRAAVRVAPYLHGR